MQFSSVWIGFEKSIWNSIWIERFLQNDIQTYPIILCFLRYSIFLDRFAVFILISLDLNALMKGDLPKLEAHKVSMCKTICLSLSLTRQTCMRKCLPKPESHKVNINKKGVCLSLRLTRHACMRMGGSPKPESHKKNMHGGGFNHENMINPWRRWLTNNWWLTSKVTCGLEMGA